MWWKKRIYMDYAGATPTREEARLEMENAKPLFGNPGGLHKEAVAAASALESARKDIAKVLGCRARSIVFTSGATESNNLAILGYAHSLQRSGEDISKTHWITSAIEHPSVLACFAHLKEIGAEVSYIQPDEHGTINIEALSKELKENTVFVSIGWANGEIGTIQPMHTLSQKIREHEKINKKQIVFHTDAGQAPLYEVSTVQGLGVDLLSLDSGKLYGPRGVGVLYQRDEVSLDARIIGGGQERGLRAGSENVIGAIGFARAIVCASDEREKETRRMKELRNFFLRELQERIKGTVLNGTSKKQLPHIVNVSLPHISSEYFLLVLDHAGIALSTKSACREGEEVESHVVRTLKGENWRARQTLRFSFGMDTRMRDVLSVLKKVSKKYEQLRNIDN